MKLNGALSAVITGGTSGLGEATARRLTGLGVRVALIGRNADRGVPLARELGGVFCKADILSEVDVVEAFSKARAAIGQERILVNCAGYGSHGKVVDRDKVSGEIRSLSGAEFDRIIQVNLMGTFRCITHSVAGMVKLAPSVDGERGVIVNTASIAAQDGQLGQSAYAAAKAAIVGMTLPLARDLMSEGIRINTIMPGYFDTPIFDQVPEGFKQVLAASVPFPKRLGSPQEFAALVELMISNTYLNGESVRLDGALRMSPR